MSDVATPAPAPEQSSFIEDLVDIWFAPSAVFARRAKSGFFLIMCVVTVGIGGLFLANRNAMQPILDGEYRRQMAEVMRQNPQMTEAQMAAGKAFADKAQTFGIFFGVPIGLFLVGLGAWITGKILGAEELGYGASVMIAGWAYLPKVLESIGMSVQALLVDTVSLTGRYQLSLGIGRFLDPDMSIGMLTLLGRVDLFTLWVSALLGIGIVVVGKLPRGRIVPAALIMWTLGAVPAFWQLLMGALRGG